MYNHHCKLSCLFLQLDDEVYSFDNTRIHYDISVPFKKNYLDMFV